MRKRAAGGAGIEKSAAGGIECGPPHGTDRPREQGTLACPDQLVAAVDALALGAPVALPQRVDGLILKPRPARGWMRRQHQFAQPLQRQASQGCRRKRQGIGSCMRFSPEAVEQGNSAAGGKLRRN